MLELYHSVNSVCAQKVRIVLAEKKIEYREHLMTLRGDQFNPQYMKLNPNAVVPTLLHDGIPVIESSVILYYLDEAFPNPSLMPRDLHQRAAVRLYNKLIDEYVHSSCATLSFATAFRSRFAGLSGEEIDAQLAKSPNKKSNEIKRDVALHGLDSGYAHDAIGYHVKLLTKMEKSLEHSAWLARESFSLADAAVFPYILRLDLLKMARIWERKPRIAAWYVRMGERPSVKKEVLERMTPQDKTPFEKLEPDPWPKVQQILKAS